MFFKGDGLQDFEKIRVRPEKYFRFEILEEVNIVSPKIFIQGLLDFSEINCPAIAFDYMQYEPTNSSFRLSR
jgi:hypothetical protein